MNRVVTCLVAAVSTGSLLLASCASPEESRGHGDAVSMTPGQAVGAVVLAPAQAGFDPKLDKTTAVAFDSNGRQVDRIEGNGIENARVEVGGPESAVFTSGGEILTIPEQAEGEINERTAAAVHVQTSTSDTAGRSTIFWLNTGYKDDGSYENRYTAVWSDGFRTSGAVPGLVLASAFCPDGSNYSIVEDSKSVRWGQPVNYWLYRASRQHKQPQQLAMWTHPDGFRPVTSSAVCEGNALRVLYGSDSTRNSPDNRILTDAAIDTRHPAPPVLTEIAIGKHSWRTPADTLTQHGDSLFWINSDGVALQSDVPVHPGARTVAREIWRLPKGDRQGMRTISVSRQGDNDSPMVASVDWSTEPAQYSVRNLVTGDLVGNTIPLPWLSKVAGTMTPSGLARYTVSDIEPLRATEG